MKKYGDKIVLMTVISLIMLISVESYSFYYESAKYNTDLGYINNLSEIEKVYKNLGDIKPDLETLGFLNISENTYERSYNKFLCEKVIVTEKGVEFYISDSCLNVYENEVKVDFDNDGKNMLYYVNMDGSESYLRYSGDVGGFQTFNLESGDFKIQGMIANEYEIVKYNNAYTRFIKQINAMAF